MSKQFRSECEQTSGKVVPKPLPRTVFTILENKTSCKRGTNYDKQKQNVFKSRPKSDSESTTKHIYNNKSTVKYRIKHVNASKEKCKTNRITCQERILDGKLKSVTKELNTSGSLENNDKTKRINGPKSLSCSSVSLTSDSSTAPKKSYVSKPGSSCLPMKNSSVYSGSLQVLANTKNKNTPRPSPHADQLKNTPRNYQTTSQISKEFPKSDINKIQTTPLNAKPPPSTNCGSKSEISIPLKVSQPCPSNLSLLQPDSRKGGKTTTDPIKNNSVKSHNRNCSTSGIHPMSPKQKVKSNNTSNSNANTSFTPWKVMTDPDSTRRIPTSTARNNTPRSVENYSNESSASTPVSSSPNTSANASSNDIPIDSTARTNRLSSDVPDVPTPTATSPPSSSKRPFNIASSIANLSQKFGIGPLRKYTKYNGKSKRSRKNKNNNSSTSSTGSASTPSEASPQNHNSSLNVATNTNIPSSTGAINRRTNARLNMENSNASRSTSSPNDQPRHQTNTSWTPSSRYQENRSTPDSRNNRERRMLSPINRSHENRRTTPSTINHDNGEPNRPGLENHERGRHDESQHSGEIPHSSILPVPFLLRASFVPTTLTETGYSSKKLKIPLKNVDDFKNNYDKITGALKNGRELILIGKYTQACSEFETGLKLMDCILEVCVSYLHLSMLDEAMCKSIQDAICVDRKKALEGFSDAQAGILHPKDITPSLPEGAPPSYTDVLKQDLQNTFAGRDNSTEMSAEHGNTIFPGCPYSPKYRDSNTLKPTTSPQSVPPSVPPNYTEREPSLSMDENLVDVASSSGFHRGNSLNEELLSLTSDRHKPSEIRNYKRQPSAPQLSDDEETLYPNLSSNSIPNLFMVFSKRSSDDDDVYNQNLPRNNGAFQESVNIISNTNKNSSNQISSSSNHQMNQFTEPSNSRPRSSKAITNKEVPFSLSENAVQSPINPTTSSQATMADVPSQNDGLAKIASVNTCKTDTLSTTSKFGLASSINVTESNSATCDLKSANSTKSSNSEVVGATSVVLTTGNSFDKSHTFSQSPLNDAGIYSNVSSQQLSAVDIVERKEVTLNAKKNWTEGSTSENLVKKDVRKNILEATNTFVFPSANASKILPARTGASTSNVSVTEPSNNSKIQTISSNITTTATTTAVLSFPNSPSLPPPIPSITVLQIPQKTFSPETYNFPPDVCLSTSDSKSGCKAASHRKNNDNKRYSLEKEEELSLSNQNVAGKSLQDNCSEPVVEVKNKQTGVPKVAPRTKFQHFPEQEEQKQTPKEKPLDSKMLNMKILNQEFKDLLLRKKGKDKDPSQIIFQTEKKFDSTNISNKERKNLEDKKNPQNSRNLRENIYENSVIKNLTGETFTTATRKKSVPEKKSLHSSEYSTIVKPPNVMKESTEKNISVSNTHNLDLANSLEGRKIRTKEDHQYLSPEKIVVLDPFVFEDPFELNVSKDIAEDPFQNVSTTRDGSLTSLKVISPSSSYQSLGSRDNLFNSDLSFDKTESKDESNDSSECVLSRNTPSYTSTKSSDCVDIRKTKQSHYLPMTKIKMRKSLSAENGLDSEAGFRVNTSSTSGQRSLLIEFDPLNSSESTVAPDREWKGKSTLGKDNKINFIHEKALQAELTENCFKRNCEWQTGFDGPTNTRSTPNATQPDSENTSTDNETGNETVNNTKELDDSEEIENVYTINLPSGNTSLQLSCSDINEYNAKHSSFSSCEGASLPTGVSPSSREHSRKISSPNSPDSPSVTSDATSKFELGLRKGFRGISSLSLSSTKNAGKKISETDEEIIKIGRSEFYRSNVEGLDVSSSTKWKEILKIEEVKIYFIKKDNLISTPFIRPNLLVLEEIFHSVEIRKPTVRLSAQGKDGDSVWSRDLTSDSVSVFKTVSDTFIFTEKEDNYVGLKFSSQINFSKVFKFTNLLTSNTLLEKECLEKSSIKEPSKVLKMFDDLVGEKGEQIRKDVTRRSLRTIKLARTTFSNLTDQPPSTKPYEEPRTKKVIYDMENYQKIGRILEKSIFDKSLSYF